MNAMIGRGPVTIMLVFSRTCPHCTTYMPIWKKLCQTQGRKANMVSMEATTYQKTPYSAKKPVSGVPSVLYVNQNGEITEAREPRNTSVMTDAVRLTSGSESASMSSSSSPSSSSSSSSSSEPQPLFNAKNASPVKVISEQKLLANAVIPGTMVSENPLAPLPSEPIVQSGGNPWAAFLLAAKQAAPAAALLGAYASLPVKRASGLSAPITRRRRRNSRLGR